MEQTHDISIIMNPEDSTKSILQQLTTRRKQLGLTQGQMAERLGVSRNLINGYETGRLNRKDWAYLAQYLFKKGRFSQAAKAAKLGLNYYPLDFDLLKASAQAALMSKSAMLRFPRKSLCGRPQTRRRKAAMSLPDGQMTDTSSRRSFPGAA